MCQRMALTGSAEAGTNGRCVALEKGRAVDGLPRGRLVETKRTEKREVNAKCHGHVASPPPPRD